MYNLDKYLFYIKRFAWNSHWVVPAIDMESEIDKYEKFKKGDVTRALRARLLVDLNNAHCCTIELWAILPNPKFVNWLGIPFVVRNHPMLEYQLRNLHEMQSLSDRTWFHRWYFVCPNGCDSLCRYLPSPSTASIAMPFGFFKYWKREREKNISSLKRNKN